MELSQRKKISNIVTNGCQFKGIDIENIGDVLNHSDNMYDQGTPSDGCILSGISTAKKLLVNQALSIFALHLLQISLIYVNTLIIHQILNEKHWQDRLTKEDYRVPTPLI